MSDLVVQLTAPNGRKYDQPIGLFINNEFVKSKDGGLIESINPTYVNICFFFSLLHASPSIQAWSHLSSPPSSLYLLHHSLPILSSFKVKTGP